MRDPVHCRLRRGAVCQLAALGLAVVALSACDPGSDSAAQEPGPTPSFPTGAEGECFNRPATRVGTSGADTIRAEPGPDVIRSLEGNDHITGLRGRDVVCAGPGADVIDHVGRSNASTEGDVHYSSQVQIDSGPGDDNVTVGTAFKINAGSGNDDVTVTHSTLVAHLGAGDDHLTATGWGVDGVHLDGGNDQVDNDSPEIEAAWRTVVHFARSSRNMRVNLVTGHASSTTGNRDRVQLNNIHGLVMAGGDNVVRGTPEMDYIDAGSGRLTAYGDKSRDNIQGGASNDRIHAGDGGDSTNGGRGDDIIYSGTGGDGALGGFGNDRIFGGDGGDSLEGGEGADQLSGGSGNDDLYAGIGCDNTIHRGGGSLADSQPNKLYGGDGDDYLTGDKGADRLDGGPGNDEGDGGWKDAGNNFITGMETLYAGCAVDF